jgi:hypothetical protein
MNRKIETESDVVIFPKKTMDIVKRGLARRYRSERRFKFLGLSAIAASLVFLFLLFASIIGNGYTAFWQTFIRLDIDFDPQVLTEDNLSRANYSGLVKGSLHTLFPGVSGRQDRRAMEGLISKGAAFELRKMVMNDPDLIGTTRSIWLTADDDVDMVVKGHIDRSVPEIARRISDLQLSWIDTLSDQGRIRKQFNTAFFTNGDSREPELAGIRGALVPGKTRGRAAAGQYRVFYGVRELPVPARGHREPHRHHVNALPETGPDRTALAVRPWRNEGHVPLAEGAARFESD